LTHREGRRFSIPIVRSWLPEFTPKLRSGPVHPIAWCFGVERPKTPERSYGEKCSQRGHDQVENVDNVLETLYVQESRRGVLPKRREHVDKPNGGRGQDDPTSCFAAPLQRSDQCKDERRLDESQAGIENKRDRSVSLARAHGY